jgi:hypothetical protein
MMFYLSRSESWTKPEIAIGFIGVFVAFFALVVTETTLHEAQVSLRTANERLEGTLADIKEQDRRLEETLAGIKEQEKRLEDTLTGIQEQEKRLENDIVDLEDATRRSLVGFAQIFERSLWLISQAERKIVYVNFVLGFGSAHAQHEGVGNAYRDLPNRQSDTSLEIAAELFWTTLKEKAISKKLNEIKFVTLDDASVEPMFLDALANRDGYEYLKEQAIREKILEREKSCRSHLSFVLRARGDDKSNFEEWRVGKRLPIQVLIAGLPPKQGKPAETRFGCIVFLLGSENIGGMKQVGKETGFYTELQHIIDMYQDFVDNVAEKFDRLHPE